MSSTVLQADQCCQLNAIQVAASPTKYAQHHTVLSELAARRPCVVCDGGAVTRNITACIHTVQCGQLQVC